MKGFDYYVLGENYIIICHPHRKANRKTLSRMGGAEKGLKQRAKSSGLNVPKILAFLYSIRPKRGNWVGSDGIKGGGLKACAAEGSMAQKKKRERGKGSERGWN